MELLEKQTIVRSETSSLSVDAAYDHERILAKNVYFDELSDSDFYSDEVSHPLQLSLNGSSEFKWNLFDGSIVYAAQHKGEVKAITCSETSNLHVGQIRWRAESDVHEESGKKRCVNKSFLARSHASGGFSLDNDNILIHEGNI